MQFIVISHQLYEIVIGLAVGLFLGGVYELLRFIRTFCKNKAINVIFTNFFDVAYSAFTGSVYCIYIYYVSNGRFRWFTAFAVVMGYIFYLVGPSKLIRPLMVYISKRLYRLICIIFFPIVKLTAILSSCFLSLRYRLKAKKQEIATEKLKLQLCECVKLVEVGDYYEIDRY